MRSPVEYFKNEGVSVKACVTRSPPFFLKQDRRGHSEFISCAFGGDVRGINWFARICQGRASAWLQLVLLKLIPQRFTSVNQIRTCLYDVWIYYSKCCAGLGGPLILVPGDHLCFQRPLREWPGAAACQSASGHPEKHADCPAHRHLQTDLTAGLFGWNHSLKCASVFQMCLIDHTNLSCIHITLTFTVSSCQKWL